MTEHTCINASGMTLSSLAPCEACESEPKCVHGTWLKFKCLSCENHELRLAAGALLDTLPKCDKCTEPATRAFRRGAARYCDEHKLVMQHTTAGGVPNPQGSYLKGFEAPEYPRARAVRALKELLKK